MATIHEMLDQILDYNRRSTALVLALKGEAPAEETAPPAPPAPPSKFTNGKTAPDHLGRVELELVERLVAEFGEAPNGYRIPRLWIVPDTDVSALSVQAQGDHAMNLAGAGFNRSIAYTYKDENAWFGKKVRAKDGALAGTLCWNGTLPALEAVLRAKIAVLTNPNQTPAYTPRPDTGVLDTVAGYLSLQSM